MKRLLIVTAVAAERDALIRGWAEFGNPTADLSVQPVGVGPAAAAAGTATLLAAGRYDAVLCAGVAGGFPGRAGIGATVLGTACVAADLGADSPDGFLTLDQLGFGTSRLAADPALLDLLRTALPAAVPGPVLTVSTVTGTAAGAAELLRRVPDAVAEAMEGFGVATAAAAAGVPCAEVRTIANPVGPRDRAGWRLPDALDALARAGRVLATVDW